MSSLCISDSDATVTNTHGFAAGPPPFSMVYHCFIFSLHFSHKVALPSPPKRSRSLFWCCRHPSFLLLVQFEWSYAVLYHRTPENCSDIKKLFPREIPALTDAELRINSCTASALKLINNSPIFLCFCNSQNWENSIKKKAHCCIV